MGRMLCNGDGDGCGWLIVGMIVVVVAVVVDVVDAVVAVVAGGWHDCC